MTTTTITLNIELFKKLYSIHTEDELTAYINSNPKLFANDNWYPLGGNENNFGVIENQQASMEG